MLRYGHFNSQSPLWLSEDCAILLDDSQKMMHASCKKSDARCRQKVTVIQIFNGYKFSTFIEMDGGKWKQNTQRAI